MSRVRIGGDSLGSTNMAKRHRKVTVEPRGGRLNIRVRQELLDELEQLARAEERTMSAYASAVLEQHALGLKRLTPKKP